MTSHRGCILVVDDENPTRLYVSRQLRQQNYEVAVAENGKQALEIARTQFFDLVLLDIVMPEMNGYSVLEQFKADPGLNSIPIIMISSADDLDGVVRCIQLGAEDYLFKPLNSILLKARVGTCMERMRLRDQEQAYLKQLQAEEELAEASDQAKGAFWDTVSRELRTPLDAIISYCEVLQKEAQVEGYTEMAPELEKIRTSGKHLLELMNNILNFAEAKPDKAGNATQTPISLSGSNAIALPTAKQTQASLILVIDDDRTIRDQLTQCFNQDGFRVITAWCGAEGIRLARELSPDLILLDMLLPHEESQRVLLTCQRDRHLANIPIIMQVLPGQSTDALDGGDRGCILGLYSDLKLDTANALNHFIDRQLHQNQHTLQDLLKQLHTLALSCLTPHTSHPTSQSPPTPPTAKP